MLRFIRAILAFILGNPLIFWTAMLVNFLAAVIGTVWWYGPMLMQSPLWAYPFIPDCPLAAFVATIAFIGLRSGKRWHVFNALAAFACIKYGLWTQAFWLKHWSAGGLIEPISAGMFITHIGLLCEGVLLLTTIAPLGVAGRLAVTAWYVLSIIIDYGFSYHPPLTPQVSVDYMFAVTCMLTFGIGVLLFLLPRTSSEMLGTSALNARYQ